MNALTLRALGELPPEFQNEVATHHKKFQADSLDLAIGAAAAAWLSGKKWSSARGDLRREHCAKYRAASRFNAGVDAVANSIRFSFVEDYEDEEEITQPRTRGEWVRHIAETRGVGVRRAQQIVAQALKSPPGDGDGGAQLRQGDLFGCDGSDGEQGGE